MTDRATATSPMLLARVAGVLFIIMAVAAELSTGVLSINLAVHGDAAATAANITGAESAFRMGILSHLVVLFTDVGVSVILYILLRPVCRTLALLATTFRLIMAAMRGINLVTHFAALTLLSGAGYLSVFSNEQVQALALLVLDAFVDGVLLDLIFFGVHLLLVGYLVLKSGFLPKWIGVWLMVAFVGYLLNSLAALGFVFTDHATIIANFIFLPSALSEFALFLWLLIKGVDVEEWVRQSLRAGAPA